MVLFTCRKWEVYNHECEWWVALDLFNQATELFLKATIATDKYEDFLTN